MTKSLYHKETGRLFYQLLVLILFLLRETYLLYFIAKERFVTAQGFIEMAAKMKSKLFMRVLGRLVLPISMRITQTSKIKTRQCSFFPSKG